MSCSGGYFQKVTWVWLRITQVLIVVSIQAAENLGTTVPRSLSHSLEQRDFRKAGTAPPHFAGLE